MVSRDHGLALALVCLMRYAGPRVGEVAALRLADARLSARRGVLVIRRGKGLKYREVPLVVEEREPLAEYLAHRRDRAQHWARKAETWDAPPPAWAAWPDGMLFLGQRGRSAHRARHPHDRRQARAGSQAGRAALAHDLRHTFAKALLDPGAYGLTRPAVPLTTVQELLGHAALATTALYTRPSYADLARLMGDPLDTR